MVTAPQSSIVRRKAHVSVASWRMAKSFLGGAKRLRRQALSFSSLPRTLKPASCRETSHAMREGVAARARRQKKQLDGEMANFAPSHQRPRNARINQ